MRLKWFVLGVLFSFSSYGISHIETGKKLNSSQISKKYWILLSAKCMVCDHVLKKLKTVCKGQKPPSKNLGFFMDTLDKKSAFKKLKSFSNGYDVYLGSSAKFFDLYNIQGSPSLILKGNQKIVQGKSKIMKKIKRSSDFCSL